MSDYFEGHDPLEVPGTVMAMCVCGESIVRSRLAPYEWVHLDDYIQLIGTMPLVTAFDHSATPAVIESSATEVQPDLLSPPGGTIDPQPQPSSPWMAVPRKAKK